MVADRNVPYAASLYFHWFLHAKKSRFLFACSCDLPACTCDFLPQVVRVHMRSLFRVYMRPPDLVAKTPFRTRFILKYRISLMNVSCSAKCSAIAKVRMPHIARSPRWHSKNGWRFFDHVAGSKNADNLGKTSI